jgi:hypothetical protein
VQATAIGDIVRSWQATLRDGFSLRRSPASSILCTSNSVSVAWCNGFETNAIGRERVRRRLGQRLNRPCHDGSIRATDNSIVTLM